jgi:putative DNA primase/helicase
MNKVKQERGTFVFKCLQAFMKANQKHEMSLTHQMQLARDEWIRLNDHFGQFLEEACLVDPNNEYGDSAKNVVEEYKYFCRENNYSDKTTAQTITEKLAKLNVKRVRSRRGFDNSDNIWRFIGLKLTKSYINPAFENKGVP